MTCHYVWIDGAINWTGSIMDLGIEPNDPVHNGSQSMFLIYDNRVDWGAGAFWSEVERPFDDPQDWTILSVKALTLYFYGDPNNDANDTEELYVGLGGSYAEVRYSEAGGDMNDLRLEEWTEWNIPIADFCGVDPCAVTSVFIGLGDRDNNTIPGGDGVVYFDDIRLYLPRCLPGKEKPVADLNGNCTVDWPDIGIVGEDWLRTDADLNPVSDPGPGNLVGYWELDGDANDSSGNGHHGTAEGQYAWVAGRIGSGAIEFTDTSSRVLVPDHPQLRPTDQVTACAWVYYSEPQDIATRVVVKGGDNVETYILWAIFDEEIQFYVCELNGERHVVLGNAVYEDEWVHVAGTYDGASVNVYINGRKVDSLDAPGLTLSQDTSGLAIGNRSDATNRGFIGKIDDVRVYDYGLSPAQVAYIATEGTGYVPLVSEANLYDAEPAGQKVISLKDFAVLADGWLEQKLWPQ